MPSRNQLVPVIGSEPPDRFAAHSVGPAHPDELITVTVKVRAKDDKSTDAAEPLKKQPTTVRREDFAAAHGADPATLKKIEDYAAGKGLKVVESCAARRRVILAGTVSELRDRVRREAGAVRAPRRDLPLAHDVCQCAGRLAERRRGGARSEQPPRGQAALPDAEEDDPRGQAIFLRPTASADHPPGRRAGCTTSPPSLDGTGQCIAIIELGGGFIQADLQTYFNELETPLPQVLGRLGPGGTNSPGHGRRRRGDARHRGRRRRRPQGQDRRLFRAEHRPGVHPGHHRRGARHGEQAVGHLDQLGRPESRLAEADRTAMNNAIRDAAMMGVTVTVASGDNGSADGVTDGHVHVDFPASSPFSLACGGTRLSGSGSTHHRGNRLERRTRQRHRAAASATPSRSRATSPDAHVPKSNNTGHFVGRGVPDVAGNADPNSGYEVRVDGSDTVVGGTSAVAPLWAGPDRPASTSTWASRSGFINPLLYSSVASSGAFHQITQGNNGAFSAGPGWNACTGLGTPDGTEILSALAPSGTPAPTPAPPAKTKAVTA